MREEAGTLNKADLAAESADPGDFAGKQEDTLKERRMSIPTPAVPGGYQPMTKTIIDWTKRNLSFQPSHHPNFPHRRCFLSLFELP